MPVLDPTQTSRTGFFRRLGYLLFGVALGFIILGLYQTAKRHQAEVDEQHRRQLRALPPPDDKLFPPIPESSQPAAPAPGPASPGPSAK